MKEDKNILLIGGTGRCGTSVLSKIFSNHPLVTNTPEWRFMIDPDGVLDFYTSIQQSWSPYRYDIAVKRLEILLKSISRRRLRDLFGIALHKTGIASKFNRFILPHYYDQNASRYSPHFEQICDDFLSNLKEFEYSGYWTGRTFGEKHTFYYNNAEVDILECCRKFLAAVMSDVMNSQNSEFYLEKNTWNMLYFDKILELLPNAKLVHIYRDPRDVVASFTKQSWMPSDPAQSGTIYNDLMNRWSDIKQSVPANSYYEISLEQLAADPESELKKICSFWDIPWDVSVLNVKLNKSHSGRWKKDFTPDEQNVVQSLLAGTIQSLDYE